MPANTSTAQNAATYCQNMVNIQTPVLKLDAPLEQGASPVPALGSTLANFLAARENASFTNLNCQNFGLTNPVTLTLDGNGVAIARDLHHHGADGERQRRRRGERVPVGRGEHLPACFRRGEHVPVGFGCGKRVLDGFSERVRVGCGYGCGERVPDGFSERVRACGAPAASPSPTASTGTHRHMNPRLFMPGSRFHM